MGYYALSGLNGETAADINGEKPNVPMERERQFQNWLPMIRSYGTAAGIHSPLPEGCPQDGVFFD
ncbi:hypothetical protein GCM10022289_48010 [Pedobacter jeongneungensis]|uniref:Uncharacterized protein n=1 Tax=Pedobacter jeongneungensis TaxID=947309 RepID=A0ABP8BQV4_9SPHI